MKASIMFRAAVVATVSLVAGSTAGAQQVLNQVTITGTAAFRDQPGSNGQSLLLDFLTGAPPTVADQGGVGTVTAAERIDGAFEPVPVGATGTLRDLVLSPTGAAGLPYAAGGGGAFLTLGDYTFTLDGTGAGTGGFAFGPITLGEETDALGTVNTRASFTVNGTVRGGAFGAAGGAYTGIFTSQFAGQTAGEVFAVIDRGGTLTNSFSASFRATPASVVPEPSTYALLGTGLAGLLAAARRRRA